VISPRVVGVMAFDAAAWSEVGIEVIPELVCSAVRLRSDGIRR